MARSVQPVFLRRLQVSFYCQWVVFITVYRLGLTTVNIGLALQPSDKNIKEACKPLETDKLAQLKSGDPTLFAELVRDHNRALIALTVPIVGISEAEEVVQNAWLKAYRAIGTFAGQSRIRTWLGSIAINEAKMQLRQRKRELLFSDHGGENQPAEDSLTERFTGRGHWQHPPVNWHMDSPESLLTGEQLAECLEKLLTAMPDNQRCILEMRDASGLSFDEICNELTVSASNARVLLHRARTQLFKLVDHYEETGEC